MTSLSAFQSLALCIFCDAIHWDHTSSFLSGLLAQKENRWTIDHSLLQHRREFTEERVSRGREFKSHRPDYFKTMMDTGVAGDSGATFKY